ncbi:MAG: hypothetical protein RIE58_00810 [Vicingaceae bacterium]
MRNLFLLSLICISLHLASQQATLQWTDEQEFDKENQYNDIVGTYGQFLYVVSSSNPNPRNSVNVTLNLFDKESLKFEKSLRIIGNKSDVNFEDVIIAKRSIHVFTSFYDRNLGLKVLSDQFYDPYQNQLGESQRVDEVHQTDKSDFIPFGISSSPDGRSILIHHHNPSLTGYSTFNLKVTNEDLELIWEKEIELNYKDRMVTYDDIILDDASTVYILTSINPYGIKKSSGFGNLLNLKNTLFSYRPFQDRLKEYEFALTRNWIQGVKMGLDEQQNLYLAAFYTYPNDYKLRGFVQFKIDSETGETALRKFTELNKEQYGQIEDAVKRLRDYSRTLVGNTGIYPGSSHMNNSSSEFQLKSVQFSNSMIILAVEALRRDERCTETFNEQQMIVNCEKHYFYGDIVLFFLDWSGNVSTVRRLPKLQHSVDRKNPFYSFGAFSTEHELFICYNDDQDNFSEDGSALLEQGRPLTRFNRSRLAIQTYTSSGLPTNFVIDRSNEGEVMYLPSQFLWTDNKELLFYSQKEKNYKFGKLLLR